MKKRSFKYIFKKTLHYIGLIIGALLVAIVFLMDTDTLIVSGTCSSNAKTIGLENERVLELDRTGSEIIGIIDKSGEKVHCLRKNIKFVPYYSVLGYPTKAPVITNKIEGLKLSRDTELEEVKKIEKRTLLVKGECEGDKLETRVIEVLSVARNPSSEIELNGLDIISNKKINCLDREVFYEIASKEFVENFKIKELVDLDGKEVLLTGVCKDIKGDIYQMVNQRIKVISHEDKVLKAGFLNNLGEGVIVSCNQRETGKFVIGPMSKRGKSEQ